MLLLQELFGKQYPEAEQSDEGSGGDDGFHKCNSLLLISTNHYAGQVLQRIFQDVNSLLHSGDRRPLYRAISITEASLGERANPFRFNILPAINTGEIPPRYLSRIRVG